MSPPGQLIGTPLLIGLIGTTEYWNKYFYIKVRFPLIKLGTKTGKGRRSRIGSNILKYIFFTQQYTLFYIFILLSTTFIVN